MSFYVEFTAASHDDALRIVVAEEFLPDSVRTCNEPSRPTTSPTETFTIRKTGGGRTSICFGPSAKHAVKTCAFRIFSTKVGSPLHWEECLTQSRRSCPRLHRQLGMENAG